jgi:hypothetical protein
MSEPRPPFVPRQSPFHPTERGEFDDSIFDQAAGTDASFPADTGDDDAGAEQRPRQREGLPPGFRMRHDAHYVDEILAGAAGRGPMPAHGSALEGPAPRPRQEVRATTPLAPRPPRAYAELAESLAAIATCRQLFRDRARPAVERAALALVEAAAARAAWLVQAMAVLDEEPPVVNGEVDLRAVAEQVARTLAPSHGFAGATIEVEAGAGLVARGDPGLIAMAVAAMTMALQAVVDGIDGAAVRLRVAEEEDGRARVEAAEDSLRIPPSWRARFLDEQWTERPGGRRAAVGLAAARRVAALHRGALMLAAEEHGGCRLTLSLPRG